MSAIKQKSIKLNQKELEQQLADSIAAANEECVDVDYSCRVLTRAKNKLKKK